MAYADDICHAGPVFKRDCRLSCGEKALTLRRLGRQRCSCEPDGVADAAILRGGNEARCLSDIKTFTKAEGLTWRAAANRVRTETDLTAWLGKRAQAGRLPPTGFPKSNKFG